MDLFGVFRALGDPVRFRIVEALMSGPKNVSDLVDLVGVPQPNVSRHLKALRDRAVILPERRGKWVEYSLDEGVLLAARRWLDRATRGSERRDAPSAMVRKDEGDETILFCE